MLVLLMLTGPAWASGQGVAVTTLTPARHGAARVSVDIRDPALLARITTPQLEPSSFGVVLGPGRGRATVHKVTRAEQEPVYTILAFDASGSFAPNTLDAVALARRYANAVPPNGRHTTEVVTFGTTLNVVGKATDGPGIGGLLDAVTPGKEAVTRLKSLVEECVEHAAAGQPVAAGGLRQVVVFTDAGEESTAYSIEDLVTSARSRGVEVHVVVFPPTRGKNLAQRLDEMRRLADETGGISVTGGDAAAPAQLVSIAESARRTVWLDLSFCGVPAASGATPSDALSVEIVEGGQRRAWSDRVPFDQDGLGPAAAACPDDAATATVTPPAADPVVPVTTPGPAASPPWGWWILGASALVATALGLGLLAFLLGRKRGPAAGPPPRSAGSSVVPPAPVPPPSPPRAAPSVEPAHDYVAPAAPLPTHDDFAIAGLPETRLLLVTAPSGSGLRPMYRMHKQSLTLGARAEGDVDLVFDVAQVSGRHAKLELYKLGTVFVTDLESTNGTYVNGRLLQKNERVALKHGDVLGLSRQLELRIDQPGLAPPVEANPAPAQLPQTAAGSVVNLGGSEAAPPRKRSQTVFAPVKPPGEEQ
ncbi:MAG: FHA domain-containing protein [Myxococcota bacterium]